MTRGVFDRFVDFSFDRPGPILIFGGTPRCSLRNLAAVILDGFNDMAASLIVGTLAVPDLLVKPGEVILPVAGEYRIPRTYVFETIEDVYLVVQPAAATRGHGRFYFSQTEVDP